MKSYALLHCMKIPYQLWKNYINWGLNWHYAQAMPYGKIVSSLLPPLDAYAWSYEVSAIKPEPKIYQSLIDQIDCQASEILFIGDTALADFTGPTTFGMSARLINRNNDQTLAEVLNDIL